MFPRAGISSQGPISGSGHAMLHGIKTGSREKEIARGNQKSEIGKEMQGVREEGSVKEQFGHLVIASLSICRNEQTEVQQHFNWTPVCLQGSNL